MTWDEFWASVFPAYLGAVGSIAASAVAVIALIRDLRTRRGLREVAQSASDTVELPRNQATLAPRMSGPGSEPLELVARGSRTVVRNLLPAPIEIVDLRVPSGGKTLKFTTTLPVSVQPGEGFGFVVQDLLGGPAIAALLVEWKSADGQAHLTTFFI
ncbi:hypothetical protein [Microbacterium sp. CFBP9034]|uniref:hypothetical protein n=1 Tax=Microbacterium sp. CFBP9034 TaxID=3096540 RepID=UPI002A6A1157|nr:hypothetical protein [Microbacterium sp. CFBP9034]MDY0909660.1 hypothetical protein [Microbacterium sp. CFBP9034]